MCIRDRGVIVGVVIVNYTGWYIIDPIIAIAVAIYILYAGYKPVSYTHLLARGG